MPVEGGNLPQHLAGAEQSQVVHHAGLRQELAQSMAAAEASREKGRQEASGRVVETRPVEDPVIMGERDRRAPPHAPARAGGRPRRPPPGGERTDDPDGRGRSVDLRA